MVSEPGRTTSRGAESRLFFHTPTLSIGRFRCGPGALAWRVENVMDRYPTFAFARNPVEIIPAGGEPVLADPGRVMVYNAEQVYRRRLVHEAGDCCEFFCVDERVLAEIIAEFDPAVADRGPNVFRFPACPCDSRTYFTQRLICRAAIDEAWDDPLALEEAFLEIARSVIASSYALRDHAPRRTMRVTTHRAHRDAAEAARAVLGERFHEPLTLADIAHAVHVSPYHLSRVFRRHTGETLHRHRNQLRLCHALTPLAEGTTDLTSLALDLGYSSHSHFTTSFQAEFGITPSAFRDGEGIDPLAKRVRRGA